MHRNTTDRNVFTKTSMARRTLLSLLLVLMLTFVCAGALAEGAARTGEGGWIYRVTGDGHACLLGHTDTAASSLEIPLTVDGLQVREIADDAFAEQTSLTSVHIPTSVSLIGEGAFPARESLVLTGYHGAEVQRFAEQQNISFSCLSEYEFVDGLLDLSELGAEDYDYAAGTVAIAEPWSDQLSEGMMIFMPADAQYSLGIPWRITGVEAAEDGVTAMIEEVYIEDALMRIHIDDVQLYPDVSNAVPLLDGVTISAGESMITRGPSTHTRSLEIGGMVKLSDTSELSFELGLKPTVTVDADLQFPYRKEDIQLSYRVEIETTKSATYKQDALKASVTTVDKDGERIKLARIPMISNGLAHVVIEVSLNFEISGEVTVEYTSTVVETGSFKDGELIRSPQEPVTDAHITGKASAMFELKNELAINVGFPGASFSTDLAQLYLAGRLMLDASTDIDTIVEDDNGRDRICLDLRTYFEVVLGLKIGLLHEDFELTVFNREAPIFYKELFRKHLEALDQQWYDSCQQFKNVTFYDGYSPEALIVKVRTGEIVEPPALIERIGYTFVDWFTDTGCKVRFDFTAGIQTDCKLYAGWEDENGVIAIGEIPPERTDDDFYYTGGNGNKTYTLHFSRGVSQQRVDGWVLTGVSGTPVNVEVPAVVDGLKVVQIGNWISLPFYGNKTLETITLPDTVDTICDGAFEVCPTLRKIDMGNGVQHIGWLSFYGDGNLEEVIFPKNLKSIANSAFEGCGNLKEIVFKGDLDSIGNSAFAGCSSVERVIFNGSVGHLGAAAFSGVENATVLKLPETFESADNYVFQAMRAVEELEIPSTWDYIPFGMFNNCNGLTRLVIPENIHTIEENAFIYSYGLEEVVICAESASVGPAAFKGCSALKTVRLPGGNAALAQEAFAETALQEIDWTRIESIGPSCFENCHSLEWAYIPEGIESLPEYAFNNCSALKEISLPSSLTYIEQYALNRTALTDIMIPGSVECIDYRALSYLNNLESLWLCDGVTTIGDTLHSADMVFARIPGSVELIEVEDPDWSVDTLLCERGSYAEKWFRSHFPDVRILYISDGMYYPVTFHSNGGSAVRYNICQPGLTVTRPADPTREGFDFTGWYTDEACTQPWNFASDVMPDGYLHLYAGWTVSESFFRGVTDSQGRLLISGYYGTQPSVTLPSTLGGYPVHGIAANAIDSRVYHLTIPAGYSVISADAFSRASGLQSIHVSDGNSSFAAVDGVLYGADGTMICYPQNKHNSAFSIPESCTAVGEYAMRSAQHLKELTVSAGVKEIRANAFYLCPSLKRVTFSSDSIVLAENLFDSVGVIQGGDSESFGEQLSSVRLYGPVDSSYLYTYAQLEKLNYNVYAVVFCLGGETIGVTSGTAGLPVIVPPSVAENAMMVKGWSTTEDGELWNFETDMMPAGTLTLYGVWDYEYEFEIVDSSNATLTRYLGSDTTIIVPEIIADTPVTAIAEGCFPSADTVTLSGNRGSAAESFAAAHGYTFITLKYALHYESNGGSLIPDGAYALGETVASPECTRDNYTFTGWYTDSGLTTLWNFETDVMPAYAITLYAGWDIIDETIADPPYTTELTDDGVVITGYTGTDSAIAIPETINGQTIVGLAQYAFANDTVLRKVTVPGSVAAVSEFAFAGSSVRSVSFAEGLTSLSASAFKNCESLLSVSLPDSLEHIGAYAFADCRLLSDFHWPAALKTIGQGAFSGCTELTADALPDSVAEIGKLAFHGCSKLTNLSLGSALMSLDASAFRGCTKLESLSVSEANAFYASIDGAVYTADGTCLIYRPENCSASDFTVPDGVTDIGPGALRSGALTSLTLPASVSYLGEGFAEDCWRLNQVVFAKNSGITAIPQNAFRSCLSLTDIELPEGTLAIGKSAFACCSALERISIPETVTSIGSGAFRGSPNTVIYGRSGSAAQQYAADNGIRFICETDTPVTGITLPEAIELEVGATAELTPVLIPENATETELVWNSSDPSIVTVDGGTVTGHCAGSAAVSVMAANGSIAACQVTVTPPVVLPEQLILSDTAVQLDARGSFMIAATVLPVDCTNPAIEWTSSDESIAIVRDGIIYGISAGHAVIQAQTHNGITAQVSVDVYQPADIDTVRLSNPYPSQYEEVSIITAPLGGTDQMEFRYAVLLEGELLLETDWITDSEYSFRTDSIGEYTVQAQARDLSLNESSPVLSESAQVWYMQSAHPCAAYTDQSWSYTVDGAEYIALTFSSETQLTNNRAFLEITGSDGELFSYTGTDLADQTIALRGDTANLRLTTGSSATSYGFEVTDICAITEEEHFELTYEPLSVTSFALDTDYPSIGDTITANAQIVCSGDTLCQYTLYVDDEQIEQTDWIEDLSYSFIPDCAGSYTVELEVYDQYKDEYSDIFGISVTVQYAQSIHPYAADTDRTWTVSLADAEYMLATFHSSCALTDGDTVIITDEAGRQTQYAGTMLEGCQLAFEGSSFTIRLISDSTPGGYGFAVTELSAMTAEEYEEWYEDLNLQSVSLSNAHISKGESFIATVECIGSGEIVYQYTLSSGDTVVSQSDWTSDIRYAFQPAETGVYTLSVQAHDLTRDVLSESVSADGSMWHLQSAHPYANRTDKTWNYAVEGAEYLALTFSSDTAVENRYDKIIVTDAAGNEKSYTGTALQGATIAVQGGSFTIRLTSDGSGNAFGFALTDVRVIDQREYYTTNYTAPTLSSLSINPSLPAVYASATVSPVIENGTGMFEYQFILTQDGAEILRTEWQQESQLTFTPAAVGTYCVSAQVRDTILDVQTDVLTTEFTVGLPQSAHPYANQTDETWVFILPEEAAYTAITFGESFAFESSCDYLQITDGSGVETRYSDTSLAGKTLYLQGSSFTLRLISDGSVTDYGFDVTEIRPMTQEEYDNLFYVPAVVESLTLSPTTPFLSEPFTVTPKVVSNAEEVVIQYTVLRGEEVVLQTEWLEIGPTELTLTEAGRYTLQAQAKDVALDRCGDVFSMELAFCLIQSDHPYADQTDQSWTYSVENAEYLAITFDQNTELESGCDYLYITDGAGTVWTYTGTELMGKTIGLRGSEFTLNLVSDYSVAFYGFGITDIVAISEETYYEEYFTPVQLESIYVSNYNPSLNNSVTVSTSAVYGTKEYEYRMTVMLNGKVCREFPWQSSRSFILPIEYVGEYEVIVEVRDVQQGGTDSMTSEPISAAIAQTRHGYPFDSRLKWFLEVDGAEYISVEFDDQFEMYETDSLLITDAAGNVRRYADTDLAGQTIALRGSICRIALSTPYDDPDYDCGCYGFRVTDLKAITQDEYQALNNLWISDVSVTPSYASLGEELSVSVDADYGENEIEYRYSLLQNGTVIEQSGWIREATHAFTPDAIGDYEITVGARSSADHSVQDAESCAANVKLIQSDHPYAENLNRTWTYSIPGADYLMITFSEDTELELEYDFVILTDANGLEHNYSGNALAGESIYTAGDSVSITLRSDSVYSEYGFEVEEIRAVSAEEYEALPGGELEIVGIHIADSEILVGSTSTVTAVTKGASSQAEYQFVVMRNEETYLTTPWQKANSCALRFDEPGDYCVTASCRDGDKLAECSWYDFFEVMYLFAGSDLFTGDEISWSYKHPQSDVDALKLTFTDSSEMYRNGCTVTITDSFGISQSFKYMDLRNATIAVRGDSFTLSAYASQDSYVDVAICSIVPITLEEYESTYIQPLSMASVRNSNSAPCLNDSTVITAMANGGSGSLNYRFSVYLNNNLLSQTDWMTANSHTVTFDQSGRYTFSAEVKDTVTGSTASGSVYGTVWVYPLQSAHFYANNTDETWTWKAPAGQKLWITFSDSTKLEPNFDRLTITDEKGLVGVYTGSELAGQEIAVTGSFSIRLTSDDSTTYYGFAVTDVRAEGESEFDITSAGVLTGYNGSDSSVTIPDSATAIAASAFAGKDSVTRVTIHSGVTHIEPGAFPKGTVLETQKNLYVLIYAEQNGYECNFSGSLMKLPAALKQIDESAFESTPAACIRLPESIAKIGSRAFADAPGLFMVYIPGSTAEIAEDAFAASEQAIILCTDGSSAHSFAMAQDMKFILID